MTPVFNTLSFFNTSALLFNALIDQFSDAKIEKVDDLFNKNKKKIEQLANLIQDMPDGLVAALIKRKWSIFFLAITTSKIEKSAELQNTIRKIYQIALLIEACAVEKGFSIMSMGAAIPAMGVSDCGEFIQPVARRVPGIIPPIHLKDCSENLKKKESDEKFLRTVEISPSLSPKPDTEVPVFNAVSFFNTSSLLFDELMEQFSDIKLKKVDDVFKENITQIEQTNNFIQDMPDDLLTSPIKMSWSMFIENMVASRVDKSSDLQNTIRRIYQIALLIEAYAVESGRSILSIRALMPTMGLTDCGPLIQPVGNQKASDHFLKVVEISRHPDSDDDADDLQEAIHLSLRDQGDWKD